MAQMGRPGLTVEQKRELWLRWQAGESLSEIGRALGKQPGSIRGVVASNGGYSGRGDAARRRVRTTIPAKKRAPFDDLVARRFVAEAANQLWCGDLTYIHTAEGFLYCASVIDVFRRRVIGWAIDTHMRAELACEALRMAVANRRGQVAGVIFHSDSEYVRAGSLGWSDPHSDRRERIAETSRPRVA